MKDLASSFALCQLALEEVSSLRASLSLSYDCATFSLARSEQDCLLFARLPVNDCLSVESDRSRRPDCSRYNFGASSTPVSRVYDNSLYCEFANSLATSWTLLATFEQPPGKAMSQLNASIYNAYCTQAPIWIQGNSEGLPLSPEPCQRW